MDAEAILHELTYARELPREALLAASERQEEMVPIFLREIEAFVAATPEDRRKPTPLFFVIHLLAEWREKSAYRPLARFLRCPGSDLEWVLGDCDTETSHRVIVSVFDGDLEPLIAIVHDLEADDFIRARMFDALAMLTLWGQTDRDEVAQILRNCYTKLQPQDECFVWNGWQDAIAMLELQDLVPLVKEACERGFIDPFLITFEGFEDNLSGGDASPLEAFRRGDPEYTLFGKAAEELENYEFYDWPGDDEDDELSLSDQLALAGLLRDPAVNPYKNVGRNDPCPCGSGKKFKKCCLQR